MEELDHWRLLDKLTIRQAALLTIGVDPSSSIGESCKSRLSYERPRGYDATKAGISDALKHGAITGYWAPIYKCDSYGRPYEPIENSIDIDESEVNVVSLKVWLETRGLRAAFFFPTVEAVSAHASLSIPDYLNTKNPRYVPKLAAAVRAWQAVTDPNGKSAKEALKNWLRENAAEFKLLNRDGKPNESGIDEVAKTANWQQGGGAPKTPGK
jgi:hypothetical protein